MKSFFNIDTYCRLITFAVFVVLGIDVSKTMPKPKTVYSWVVLVSVMLLLAYVGIQVKLVSVFGYTFYINEAVIGLTSGLIVGFVLRVRPKFRIR